MTIPSTQPPLFDLKEGRRRKDEAMDAFEQSGREWLMRARSAAAHVCRLRGMVTTDDVLAIGGMPPAGLHHNIIGAIFPRGTWEIVGYTKTQRPEGHARRIGIWCLKERHDDRDQIVKPV